MAATKRELKKFIKGLENIRGRHTELVTVYVPAGYDLFKVTQHLAEEQGTAKNIKDAKTRGNVIDSLERCIRHLKLIGKTLSQGMALFAGNVSAQEGKIDIELFSIEPPEPLKVRMYRCDQTFMLDVLRDQLEAKECYGLIVMDRREASIGFLKGKSIKMTAHLNSGVPGKFKAGGQSSQRLERLIAGMALEFYKRIAEICNKEFLGMKDLKGILVGGPGPTKEAFIEELNNEIKKKILAVQDITYTDESGLHHLVDKSQDVLEKEAILTEKKIVERFLTVLAKNSSMAAYGKAQVEEALDLGAVDELLLSESLDDAEIERLEQKAKNYGTKVPIISLETREGEQLRDLGGYGAILRYSIGAS